VIFLGGKRLSSSVGYAYSYVDMEAAARRRLRAEIAEYAARTRMARAQASGLADARNRVAAGRIERPRAGADSTGLAQTAARLRDQAEAAERDLAALVADTWAARLADPASTASTAGSTRTASGTGTGLTAAQELAWAQAGNAASHARAAQLTSAGSSTASELRAAERLMARELPRCDPADLELLQRPMADLRAASRTDAARRALADLELAVTESIARRRRAERVAAVRASLLALADDALPEDHGRLRSMIESAPEPGDLSAAVGRAVARADAARARDAVARAAAEALAEIGCDVGDDFATLLTAASESIVPFGSGWAPGYGLLVRLPAGQERLQAAVVRRADVAAGPQADESVQRQFCASEFYASGLDSWLSDLDGQGVRIRQEHRVEPGQSRVAAMPTERWPARAGTAQMMARKKPRAVGRPAAARELHRER
jgi:hypothetical protein